MTTHPHPSGRKTWTITTFKGNEADVEAYSIDYERNHVVFKGFHGVTIKAYHADSVAAVTLKTW